MSNGFGTPSYGNTGGTFYKNWKLQTPDGAKGEVKTSFCCLIVPPMKSLADSGKWGVYHGQHFGYSGTDPRNPDKTKMRPFSCIEKSDFRTKMITVACAACDVITEKFEEKKRREAEYIGQGLNEAQVKERLDPLTQWLKRHNCDRKWHINVMNQQGEFGVLQISHTVKKMLDAKMDELRKAKRPVDPIVDGVWFEFTRMGKFPVQDAVEVMMVENEDGSFNKKIAPLTEEQAKKALEVCPDLAKDTVRFISGQQIAQIVASSGDPEEIDRIWQLGVSASQRRERTPVSQNAAPAPAPTAARETAVAPTAEQDEEAALMARLAALQAKKANPTVVVTGGPSCAGVSVAAGVSGPAMAMVDEAELTDEEFYKRYGVKAQ